MATFEDYVQEVLRKAEGYLNYQDVWGTVSDAGGAGTFWDATGTTTGTVAGPSFPGGSGFDAGLIEVSDELIYAGAFDRATGIFTNCLRGYLGTTAVAHVAAEPVRNNPRFPRIDVKRAINDTLNALYPDLPAVATTEFSVTGGTTRYDLPTTAREVYNVAWQDYGSSGHWTQSKWWDFEPQPGGESAGNRSIDLHDVPSGRTVRVTYLKAPSELSDNADVYSTTTGLEDWTRELVVYGSLARLVGPAGIGRTVELNASQRLINDVNPVGTERDLAQWLEAMFRSKLEDAKRRFRTMYPVRTRRSLQY